MSEYLLAALGIQDVNGLDPSGPLRIGEFELGQEATEKALQILQDGVEQAACECWSSDISEPCYWSLDHEVSGDAQVFVLPAQSDTPFPTAMEVALVRAFALLPPAEHQRMNQGGVAIALGVEGAWRAFKNVVACLKKPIVGESKLFSSSDIKVMESADRLVSGVMLRCLATSFVSSPLKFRFIELYRMAENRFLADIVDRFTAEIYTNPGKAASEATEALKSELKQMQGLAEKHQAVFEALWDIIDDLRQAGNVFADALFDKLKRKKLDRGGKWMTGAALVYQVRCSVVHAGEKDIIFEGYPDGDAVIEGILPHVEDAALRFAGIELLALP